MGRHAQGLAVSEGIVPVEIHLRQKGIRSVSEGVLYAPPGKSQGQKRNKLSEGVLPVETAMDRQKQCQSVKVYSLWKLPWTDRNNVSQ